MALLWMDGFDHYAAGDTGRAQMTDGAWAEVSSSHQPEATTPRTGRHAIKYILGNSNNVARRVLGGAKTTVGIGMAFRMDELPTANDSCALMQFRDAGNAVNVTVCAQTTGVVSVFRGVTTALLGQTAVPVIFAETYQHIEVRASFALSALGTVEVRVNGVTVLSLQDVQTAVAYSECSQVTIYNNMTMASVVPTCYIDDVFAWDDTGATNNDFLGDRRVRLMVPDADTAVADWAIVGAASGYDAINDADRDDETTYINGDTPAGTPVMSEFSLENPVTGIGAIAAVQTVFLSRKTDAGDCNVQLSMLSGSSASEGTDHPLTEQYTYRHDVHPLNPDTGTPWTEATLTAAKLRIARTL